MATNIYFAGEKMHVAVEETPSQVAAAFNSADGRPVRLTGHGRQVEVYINPATVAFWSDSEASPESQPQEAPQPPTEQPAVTDIWGRPLRKRRRR